ncbi:hypothetical protein Pcinc_013120 [Petrolisthes cinctipes]|uniref:Tudor domain-containing protein n=1 Tax=Petrolisthes cinctipes TaxID=88211 RepID=A0AAE1KRW9_PETCI|nr:hypothetical protein Pcinc_013120 [Petrolisthes cinctipes]
MLQRHMLQGFQRCLDLSSAGTSSTSDNLLTSPKSLIRELQNPAPQGMHYVVTLVPEDKTSFKAVIKARGRPSTSATQPQKRHRISMHGAVLTDEKFHEQQKNKEKKKKKKAQEAEESDSDVDDSPQVEAIYDSSGELSDVNDDNLVTLDKTVKAALGHKELHQELPKENEIKEGMYYAVMYDRPSTYYWGKILKVFHNDEDSQDNKVEVTFMKKTVPSSNLQV